MNPRHVRQVLLSSVAVASTGSAESAVISLAGFTRIESVVLKAAAPSGSPDVKIEYATSPDGTNFDSYDDNTDITSSTATAKPNNTQGFNAYTMPNPLNLYVKFKVTGVGSNPAGTVVNAYLILYEGGL